MTLLIILDLIALFGILIFIAVMDYREKDALEKKWKGHPLRAYFTAEDLEKASKGKWDD